MSTLTYDLLQQYYTGRICRKIPRTIPHGQGRQARLSGERLFLMLQSVFDPIFRWLHSSVIPSDPTVPDFLLPSPCAYADDFAVAASSFRTLMAAFFFLRSRWWTGLLGSTGTIGNVVGRSTAVNIAMNCCIG